MSIANFYHLELISLHCSDLLESLVKLFDDQSAATLKNDQIQFNNEKKVDTHTYPLIASEIN